jgi:hypothetical protein
VTLNNREHTVKICSSQGRIIVLLSHSKEPDWNFSTQIWPISGDEESNLEPHVISQRVQIEIEKDATLQEKYVAHMTKDWGKPHFMKPPHGNCRRKTVFPWNEDGDSPKYKGARTV